MRELGVSNELKNIPDVRRLCYFTAMACTDGSL